MFNRGVTLDNRGLIDKGNLGTYEASELHAHHVQSFRPLLRQTSNKSKEYIVREETDDR